jgi:hypothetical protein
MLVHLPPQHAGSDSGGMAHIRQHAGFVPSGKYMPVLAMAACATCQLARHTATKSGSFLTFFLHVVFFDNPLVKVVFFVKNSISSGCDQ